MPSERLPDDFSEPDVPAPEQPLLAHLLELRTRLLWCQIAGQRIGFTKREARQRVKEFNAVMWGVEVERSTQ